MIGLHPKEIGDGIVLARFSLWRLLFFALFFLVGLWVYIEFKSWHASPTYLTSPVYAYPVLRVSLQLFVLFASCAYFAMIVRILIFGTIAIYIREGRLCWATLFGDRSIEINEIRSIYMFFIPIMFVVETVDGPARNIPVGLTTSRAVDVISKIPLKSKITY